MEYGLPPPRRIKQRRDRKMAKKQVHTMATAEEVAPGRTGTFPCGQQMVKYDFKETAECTPCKKAHEESGSSWNRELPKETIGHIQSTGCLGQKEVVTAAHNACIRELLQEVDGHGKADRHVKLLTIETESRLGTLWDQEQCTHFCSKDVLWEAAKAEETKIPWKDAKEGSPVPEEQYQERFWRRRLDGIGLDTINKELLAIEFKRTRDARSNYVEKAIAVAQEQYTSLLSGLQAVGQVKGWKVQQLVFVGGTCGSVHVESFNKNMKALGVLESKWDLIRQKLVRRLLERQDKCYGPTSHRKVGREVKGGEGFRAMVGNMSSGTCMREEGAKSACGPKPND
jgi:hypothetical protein